MKGLKQISARCSGLITEAQLLRDLTQEDVAKFLDYTDTTLRNKSREKKMYTLPLEKIVILADLAGYEIEFVKRAAG